MVRSQELRQYFVLFLRWSWLIVICAALGAGAAYAYGSRITPVYTATATLLVQKGGTANEPSSMYYSEQLARTHSQMLKGRPVMEAAIARLGLPLTPQALANEIKTAQVPDTGLIRLSVKQSDPAWAAQIANAVAEAFVAHNQVMQQSRYADYLTGVQVQMQEMSALIEETTAAIAAMGTPITNAEHAELARLETSLTGYRTTYATLWNNYEHMRLTAALSTDSVVVFEVAEVPRMPDAIREMQNVVLAAVVGAMLAGGITFLIEYLDDTIKSPDDVSAALGLNTLGAIGRMKRRQKELVVADHPRSPITEAYRRLRTNVRFSSLDSPLHTLLVTSPSVTEGKSVTVANLATAMAQAGLNVAVVDGDLRRPRQHRLFALEQSEGLTESLLKGRVDGNLRFSEEIEGLGVLTSGEIPPNPADLVGSQRMQALLEELKGRVDIVIIDSPPLLPVTDAAILAQNVDGVLLVVEAGRTRRGAASQAVESLRQVNANLLGAVLNAVPLRKGGHYYYYYYYYHQGYYGDGKEKRKRRRHKRGLLAGARRSRKQRADRKDG